MTGKQITFIENYCTNGQNATQAALKAGYSPKGLRQTAHNLLTNTYIATAINKRLEQIKAENTTTREERQRFWAKTMKDTSLPMVYRLKASELFGKSEADFTENLNTNDLQKQRELDEREVQAAEEIAVELNRKHLLEQNLTKAG